MFQVFENDRPCDFLEFPKVHPSWNQSKYEKFEDALCYARKWLGPFHGGSYDGLTGIVLEVNEPYQYDTGSEVVIRKVK